MKSLQEEYFDEPEFGSVSISDFHIGTGWHHSDDPEEWQFVEARTMSRDVMLYNEGLYRVLKVKDATPLTDSVDVFDSMDDVLDEMPRKLKKNHVIPSPSGEYITVKEVRKKELDDGTIEVETSGRTSTIPVELVYRTLTYDEVVTSLLDV